MGIFDKFKKKEKDISELNFASIDSNEKAEELVKQGKLCYIYIVPLRLGGKEDISNRLYGTKSAFKAKEKFDNLVIKHLSNGDSMGYGGNMDYKDGCVVPLRIHLNSPKDKKEFLKTTIEIWKED